MRYFFLLISLLLSSVVSAQKNNCERSVNGVVLSLETKEPLPFATISVLRTNLAAVASETGEFQIDKICEEEIDLEIRYVGYKTVVHHHDFHHGNPVIYLAADETILESIIVEGKRTEEIQSLSVQRKELDKLSIVNASIGELTAELSGVSILNTGTNISKPMIHGLHSNRVLVINQGVRHAFQVWGQEHAPEIDPSHVDQIEIVKGASTVKYGPEALGGVILYNSKKPAFDKKLNGSVGTSYQTNGGAISSQLNLGQGTHRFGWNVSAFGVYQGDMEAPDYTLSNTGKREFGGSFNTLLHQKRFDLQISGSYFQQELGILRGSLVGNLVDLQNAIERTEPNPTFDATYDIQNPKQETEHSLLKSDLTLFLGDHMVNFQYAIQQNVRREFDVRRGELNDRPVIDLSLISHTIEADWVQPTKGRWSGNTGVQVFTQNSANKPDSNPQNFIPDYEVLNMGAFTVQSYSLDETVIELGARYDFQTLYAADTIRETTIYSNEVDYGNFTFTLGIRKQLSKSVSLFSNIGSAWRPPNVAELYSFGYHYSRIQFGLWRYELEPEISTSNILDDEIRPVAAEESIKWVTGIEIDRGKTKAEFIIYTNHINNYIFLRPYGITTNIAGTFPYFLYDQTDAFFFGSDWDIRVDHTNQWSSEIKVSYVHAFERGTQQPLIEIPPLNIFYALDYKKGNWGYGLNLSYTASQWNAPPVIEPIAFQDGDAEINRNEYFDFMAPPDGFFLVGANVSFEKAQWKAGLNVNNVFNTTFRSYTDRLRYFADGLGRNISFSIQYRF